MNPLAIYNRPSCLYWSKVDKWTPTQRMLLFGNLPDGWKQLPIYEFAIQICDREKVEQDKRYQMVGVKWYGEGVFYRETVLGKEQSANYLYPVKPGAIIYNRLFAWKESFAVVPEEFAGFYVSNEFPQFEINKGVALPEYIYLLFSLKQTIKAVNAASIGSAAISRNRFKELDFLDFKVPIPPLPVQQKIVEYYENAQLSIQSITRKIEKILHENEKELLKRIEIQIPDVIPRKGHFIINLSKNERWDTFFFRDDFISLDAQIRAKNFITLGKALNFISRCWKPSDFPTGFFNYIEISSVTKNDGVTTTRTASVREAPSRATTMVKEGDLIISTTRPYLGAFTIIQSEHDGFVCSSGFAVADSLKTDRLRKEFILIFLKSCAGLRQMERRMSGGLYPAIVQSELERILIPIPSLKIQEKIIEKYNEGLEEIKRLKMDVEKIKNKALETVEQIIIGIRPVEDV